MTDEQLQQLKEEVDALQVQIMKENPPWYRSIPTIIAVLAFVLSLSTTGLSFYISHQNAIRGNRAEALKLIQRLTKLPIENYALMKTYQYEPDGQQLSKLVATENAVIVQQAMEMVDRYPDSFSAVEYLAIGTGLRVDNKMFDARRFFEKALALEKTPMSRIYACRELAAMEYGDGDAEEGRRYIQEAFDTWGKYSNENRYFILTSDLETHFTCILGEQYLKNIKEVEYRLAKVEDLLEENPQYHLADFYKARVAQVREALELN